MSRINDTNPPLTLDPQIDEDRVRRALGLKTNGTTHQQRPEQARQRHRFATDGSVPVVMLNRADGETTSLKERIGALEHTLENERAAHAGTRRTLSEAQAAYQTLQTRFGHTELSHGEALKTEREARRVAEEALAALRAERAAMPVRRVAKAKPIDLVETDHGSVEAVEVEAGERDVEPLVAPVPRATRKPRVPKEPKPVRWWTPSFRAKKG